MSKDDADVGQPFDEPRLAINRVYTRHGDHGHTRLVGGQDLPKDHLRIEAYGTVDELNAGVGIARADIEEAARRPADPAASTALGELAARLLRVQHELFNLGSLLATLPADLHPRQPRPTQADVDWLESEMDRCQPELPALRSFVLPGGSRLDADLHLARTVCRRAERLCVALGRDEAVEPGQPALDPLAVVYLNRLSDAFFVWSRWVARVTSAPETLWRPNVASQP